MEKAGFAMNLICGVRSELIVRVTEDFLEMIIFRIELRL